MLCLGCREHRLPITRTKDDKEYRHAYAEENLNATIATQIKVLREQRHWKQEDLAKQAEMKQPMISRYENVNYSSWSINTLRKFAKAFDVYLDVRFRSFRELVKIADSFNRETLEVLPFTKDPFFQEPQLIARHVGNQIHRSLISQEENVRNISEVQKILRLFEQQREIPQRGTMPSPLKLLQPRSVGEEPGFRKSLGTPMQATMVDIRMLTINPPSTGSLETQGERRMKWLNQPMPVQ